MFYRMAIPFYTTTSRGQELQFLYTLINAYYLSFYSLALLDILNTVGKPHTTFPDPWVGAAVLNYIFINRLITYYILIYTHIYYMQNTSCEMQGWMKHKLESRLPG